MLWGLIYLVLDSWAEPDWGLWTLTPVGDPLGGVNTLQFVGHPLVGVGFECVSGCLGVCSSYLCLLVVPVFSGQRSFLVCSRVFVFLFVFFVSNGILQIAVILVCSWGEQTQGNLATPKKKEKIGAFFYLPSLCLLVHFLIHSFICWNFT